MEIRDKRRVYEPPRLTSSADACSADALAPGLEESTPLVLVTRGDAQLPLAPPALRLASASAWALVVWLREAEVALEQLAS